MIERRQQPPGLLQGREIDALVAQALGDRRRQAAPGRDRLARQIVDRVPTIDAAMPVAHVSRDRTLATGVLKLCQPHWFLPP
jgi:hypothetical protein